MSKIHPISPSSHSSLERETFTIWMKSLVFHGNGCTVYNSRGEVAFRVDNYQKKCSRKVLLMDSSGQVLFSLHTKVRKKKRFISVFIYLFIFFSIIVVEQCLFSSQKLGIFRRWEGFKWTDSERRNARPLFRVRKNIKFLSKDISCQVINLGFDKNSGNNYYSITGLEGKSALKIVDFSGQLLAEVSCN